MPRKPALLSSLFNLMLRPIAGQTLASLSQDVVLPQHPLPTDREAWHAYWKAQGQPWRTEPEIDRERQAYLAARRAISSDIEHGIYPFRGIKLSRADVEWLVATHENGRGPIDWDDESQRQRERLDVRGADLSYVDLSGLPLSRLHGGLGIREQRRAHATEEQYQMAAVCMQGANLVRTYLKAATLSYAHLEGASLRWAHLENANLRWAHLEHTDFAFATLQEAHLREAHLEGANLGEAYLQRVRLENTFLSDEKRVGPLVADAHWDDVNLAVVNWSQIKILGDESQAAQRQQNGKRKDKEFRLKEHHTAVRANRQLAVALQGQGLNEEATRFAYRAQVLQKRVWWFQMLQGRVGLKQYGQAFGAWLFSWFLDLLSGYGYKMWRSFLAYALVVVGFTIAYYLLGASGLPSLSLVNALALSMTSFHGRGFFPGVTQLNDTLTILASIEAFVGLILEATFIATLTQRFFGK